MMNYNNNNIVLCGSSLEDLENGMIALRSALASGAVMGVGGSSLEEVERGLDGLREMVGAPHDCPCNYDCATCDYCECEDEDEDEDDPYWGDEDDWDEDEEDEDEDDDLDPDDLPEPVKAVLSAILAALADAEL